METDILKAPPPTTVYVGSDETLEPDELLLYQRAVTIGAPISLVVGQGQFHGERDLDATLSVNGPGTNRDFPYA